ncbi:MAG: 1,4-dihydroxy-2-naphthoate octaprenyltransferase [Gammaproteobacteria bacterium]|nr:MAG: 1,4-dihydroxy-2-naphthoate octaprenyltransferase [Pseudomonadota bacterium]PIE38791.1 MAG: 1,4-dihydroxy-2-naphthoate octaprenyltransferase [Gammaproteobacteria bacterium]
MYHEPGGASRASTIEYPVNNWLLAIRPRTLPASIAPIILGNALVFASESFSWLIAIASVCCAILLQIGVNLANDYFDYHKGVDTPDRLGPIRVTQAGLIQPEKVWWAMWASLFFASLFGSYLVLQGGMPVFMLGVAALVAALSYSGGPYPFASLGLGEVVVFIFFGLVSVGGCYYLQTHTLSWQALIFACVAGLPVAAILLVNNTRDIPTDTKAGKRTLSVRFGRGFSQRCYLACMMVPFVLIAVDVLFGAGSWPLLFSLLLVPVAWRLSKHFNQASGGEFNPLLGATAKFTLQLCLLVAALVNVG